MKSHHNYNTQQGVVMVISLIMLLAITLIIVSASNLVQSNLKIVQNMESHEMVRFAANAAIEEALSSKRFADNPTAIFAVNCLQNNRKCYDLNGDGETDIVVNMATPTCIIVEPIKNLDLDVFNNPDEASCFLPSTEYSMCAGSVWELKATATDVLTGAEVVIRQGVAILTTVNNISTSCPV